ncbi:DNA-binding IclR family transcriptional regulator [Mycobacterium sp. AZCC_0083]|nr:DNA-binding IclR family transcriptional regulator [Mycobacterium sp. AZCC_0083]
MGKSTPKSPPTRRAMDVVAALADSIDGYTSAELARRCAITTSTCALVLAELERGGWVARYDDRRYGLGSGLFGVVHGLRRQFPLLDRGRDALVELHERLGAGCSMSKIGDRHLTTVDTVGHATDGEHAVGHRFPIDPPFGLVAMAWRDDVAVADWLQRVTPRLTQTDIEDHRRVLGDIRRRGYGAWRFDDASVSLHDRLVGLLASLEPATSVTRQLSTLMTMVTLQSVTRTLETELVTAEFVVLPIFGTTGQPEYQIEIHLARTDGLTLDELDAALRSAQDLLAPGVA